MKILLTGGGTGGHVMPILAVISEVKNHFKIKTKEPVKFLWLGSKFGPEKIFAKESKITFREIPCGKLRRYFSLQNFVDIFRIPIGVTKAFFVIRKFKPDVAFSKGGYVSVPSVLACVLLSVPCLTHESDVALGLSNKKLLRFVDKIALTFPETQKGLEKFKDKLVITGNPIRKEILTGSKKRGYRIFGLEYGKPAILILGGSQGARKINEVLIKALPHLLSRYQIIHLCGKKNFNEIRDAVSKISAEGRKNYHLFSSLYGEKMADALTSSDLVISRAGSNTLGELATLGKPAILIPYPYASAFHQRKNAEIFVKKEAAEMIDEIYLTKDALIKKIDQLFSNPAKLENLSTNMINLSNKIDGKAAEKIADELLKLKTK
jgi:UDP-N-acetylglucosamine--N-acetylmuramyl-(pentapeptide) pyrophosphoryl-undecaprenol N-acetylglucosamine transferase